MIEGRGLANGPAHPIRVPLSAAQKKMIEAASDLAVKRFCLKGTISPR